MILPNNIIVVEDEVITQHYLRDILISRDISVVACLDNAEDTIRVFGESPCDMILMDLDLSGATDGLTLARKILIKRKVPIIFISAYSDSDTRQEAFDISYGFIAKPFTAKEVLSAIELAYSKFQNSIKKVSITTDIILSNEYRFLLRTNELYYQDRVIMLSPKETKLLHILAKNHKRVVSCETITKEVWGDKETSNSNLRNFIYKIRKLAPNLSISSDYNNGYILS